MKSNNLENVNEFNLNEIIQTIEKKMILVRTYDHLITADDICFYLFFFSLTSVSCSQSGKSIFLLSASTSRSTRTYIYIYGIDEKTKKRYTERKNKKNLFITFFVMSTFMTWSFFITDRQTIRQDEYEMKPASICWSFIL
jgi:hypothetical protein